MPYTKVIQSGRLIEKWVYEREPAPERLRKRKTKIRRIRRPERRLDAIKACRDAFRRLVRANLDPETPPALMTLTMRDVTSVDVAYKRFTLFGKRLRRAFAESVSYIAVPEFQKRGAVHFHVLVFGLKYEDYSHERSTRRIAALWREGFVDILRTDGHAKLSSYLSKYMSKAMHDPRLVGKRAYSASRNVLRPVCLRTPLQIRVAFEEWGLTVDKPPVREREYGTLYLGRCVYKSYVI